jgi:hypothetical protein
MADDIKTLPQRSGTIMTKSSTFSESAVPDTDPGTVRSPKILLSFASTPVPDG